MHDRAESCQVLLHVAVRAFSLVSKNGVFVHHTAGRKPSRKWKSRAARQRSSSPPGPPSLLRRVLLHRRREQKLLAHDVLSQRFSVSGPHVSPLKLPASNLASAHPAAQARASMDKTTSRLLNLIAAAAEPEPPPRPPQPPSAASSFATDTVGSAFPSTSGANSFLFTRLREDGELSGASGDASPSVSMAGPAGRAGFRLSGSPSDFPDNHHERADSSELIEWALGLPEFGAGARARGAAGPRTAHTS